MSGTVTISIEVELAWGTHDLPHDNPHLSGSREKEDTALRRLLAVCENQDIEISFDVVGHLFHECCEGAHASPIKDGWFSADPGTDVDSAPQYYAPDLVRRIIESEVNHEICTHTYSHTPWNSIDEDVFLWELDRVSEIHDDHSLPSPMSFIPPRHEVPPFDLLREAGIAIVRRPLPNTEYGSGTAVSSVLEILFDEHPMAAPEIVDGIVETYSTPHASLTAGHLPTGQKRSHRVFSAIPIRVRRALHERYLRQTVEKVVSEDSYVHMWAHLYDFANDHQWPGIRSFLEMVGDAKDAGELDVLTMRGLAEDVDGSSQSSSSGADQP